MAAKAASRRLSPKKTAGSASPGRGPASRSRAASATTDLGLPVEAPVAMLPAVAATARNHPKKKPLASTRSLKRALKRA